MPSLTLASKFEEKPSFDSEQDSASYRLLDEKDSNSDDGYLRPSKRPKTPIFVWAAHLSSILFCLSLLLATVSVYSKGPKNCLDKFYSYSPLLEAVDENDFQDVKFKYSLWYQSEFKGPPTPEVQSAWSEILRYGEISVSASTIEKIGHNTTTSAQFPPEVGGGYIAIASGTHALHCLHYIWEDHYVDTIPSAAKLKVDVPEMYERHFEHCVDYIRQYVMCKFDTTILPLAWVRKHQNPTPNGNTWHKCVNWDSVQNWLQKEAVDEPEGFVWRQPEGVVALADNP